MDWKDIWERAGKTFVQAFFCVLIPELCGMLQLGFPTDWPTMWAILAPVICAALAAGISAAWNIILEALRRDTGDE